MTESEEKTIRRIYQALISAVAFLVFSQLIAFFLNSVDYIIGIVAAIVIAGLRYWYLHKRGADIIEKVFTFVIVVMAVFGPIIFILVKWLVMGESILGIEFLMAALFILPIILMIYCIYLLRGLLPNVGTQA